MFRLPDSIFLHFKEKWDSISSDMNRKPNLVTEEVQKHITIVQVNWRHTDAVKQWSPLAVVSLW